MNEQDAKGAYMVFIIIGLCIYVLAAEQFTTFGAVATVVASMIVSKIVSSLIK